MRHEEQPHLASSAAAAAAAALTRDTVCVALLIGDAALLFAVALLQRVFLDCMGLQSPSVLHPLCQQAEHHGFM